MRLGDVRDIMEAWAPRQIAWERDNVGIQLGSPSQRIRGILVSVDVSDGVIREAIRKRADLIISHHPIFFHPLRRVSPEDRRGRHVSLLLRSGIAVYSAHTNLDFTMDGVSMALADRLGLRNVRLLEERGDIFSKVVVFVPPDYRQRVMEAMARAGAGVIGDYESCSFGLEGSGTFRGREGTRPFTGRTGKLENVREVRLEMVSPRWKVADILAAMRAAHPYEEVAYDVYDLTNRGSYGAGAIGEYNSPLTPSRFLSLVKKSLRAEGLRHAGRARAIRRVAVCGGSGSEYLSLALERGADAYVTADVSYHRFDEAERILLVDAGHFETEYPAVGRVVAYLKKELSKRQFRVRVSAVTARSNPVRYHT